MFDTDAPVAKAQARKRIPYLAETNKNLRFRRLVSFQDSFPAMCNCYVSLRQRSDFNGSQASNNDDMTGKDPGLVERSLLQDHPGFDVIHMLSHLDTSAGKSSFN